MLLPALFCAACTPNFFGTSTSDIRAYEASDEIAQINPQRGQRIATVELFVDPQLEVSLHVIYLQNHRKLVDGCWKTKDMALQSSAVPYYRDIEFPVGTGNSTVTLTLDDILPGKCEFRAGKIWFSVKHRLSGIDAVGNDGNGLVEVLVGESGTLSLPRRQVSCYPIKPRVALVNADTVLRCDLADSGTNSEKNSAETVRKYFGPISPEGAAFALDFRYVSDAPQGQTTILPVRR